MKLDRLKVKLVWRYVKMTKIYMKGRNVQKK